MGGDEERQAVTERYVQTWNYVARWTRRLHLKWLRRYIEKFCGLVTGHEASKTEWGYGGGPLCDVWCRWCNHRWQIPLAEHPRGLALISEMAPELLDRPRDTIR